MKVKLTFARDNSLPGSARKRPIIGGYCTVTRQKGDMPVSNESHLLHRIKLALIARGFDVIKKRMWRDGHLVSDTCQYIRTRKVGTRKSFCIWDSNYAIRDAAKDFRKDGEVCLRIEAI